jgi:hypothetical protein
MLDEGLAAQRLPSVWMLQQDADHLYLQHFVQLVVMQGINHGRVVLDASLPGAQRAQHIGIHRQAMAAIHGEEHWLGQEPLLRNLLYALS